MWEAEMDVHLVTVITAIADTAHLDQLLLPYEKLTCLI